MSGEPPHARERAMGRGAGLVCAYGPGLIPEFAACVCVCHVTCKPGANARTRITQRRSVHVATARGAVREGEEGDWGSRVRARAVTGGKHVWKQGDRARASSGTRRTLGSIVEERARSPAYVGPARGGRGLPPAMWQRRRRRHHHSAVFGSASLCFGLLPHYFGLSVFGFSIFFGFLAVRRQKMSLDVAFFVLPAPSSSR